MLGLLFDEGVLGLLIGEDVVLGLLLDKGVLGLLVGEDVVLLVVELCGWLDVGLFVLGVELTVVFNGKLEVVVFLDEGDEEEEEAAAGRGWSFARRRRVSAATMPPIEWPMRTVCTDGSTVGEGVDCATSMSMTLFCSLWFQKHGPDGQHKRFYSKLLLCLLLSVVGFKILCGGLSHHSLNLSTQSFNSPLVSNFGYWTARTSIRGKA